MKNERQGKRIDDSREEYRDNFHKALYYVSGTLGLFATTGFLGYFNQDLGETTRDLFGLGAYVFGGSSLTFLTFGLKENLKQISDLEQKIRRSE